jgi:hypothetical protein
MQAICATQALQRNRPQLAISQIVAEERKPLVREAFQTVAGRLSVLHLPYVLHDLFQIKRLL